MLKGINDTPQNAKELAKLLKGVAAKVNLIPFNSFKESNYQVSTPAAIETFKNILTTSGILTTVRKTRGDDVAGACGQLAGKVTNKRKIIS
jgi:23S rRNA (adenine2503-C2)-methyltransferase